MCSRNLKIVWHPKLGVIATVMSTNNVPIRLTMRAGKLNKWLKMVFILVFEFRRCFRLFCTQACSSSHEMAPMVQKMKHPDNLLRNLKKRRLTSNYMSVKTHNDQ